ncbi:hypothetical protein MASR2M47_00310 [Draconibacterium sp.]
MKTIKVILMALTICTIGLNQSNGQKLSQNEALKVLAKWEGNWQSVTTLNESVWIPKKMEIKGDAESKLLLQNKFLEIAYKDSKNIIRYEPVSMLFNRWEFKSDGAANFWTGEWNESQKTMNWKYVDISNFGIVGEVLECFKSVDNIETKATIKDHNGNILLENETISKKK